MMKPGMGSYDKFKEMFDHYSKLAGKKQYLIPYFISAHPGTTDKDMVNLALWLKENNFKLDQVQNFYPSPLANATTLYHTELNSLRNITSKNLAKEDGSITVPKGAIQRRLHKAILRYHDSNNWPEIRAALTKMGLSKLIGSAPNCLVPRETRNEQRHQNNDKRQGKNNSQGFKSSPGQKRNSANNKQQAKKGLTRFSNDQFNDRAPSNRKPSKAKVQNRNKG